MITLSICISSQGCSALSFKKWNVLFLKSKVELILDNIGSFCKILRDLTLFPSNHTFPLGLHLVQEAEINFVGLIL